VEFYLGFNNERWEVTQQTRKELPSKEIVFLSEAKACPEPAEGDLRNLREALEH